MDNGRFGLSDHDFWHEPYKNADVLVEQGIDTEDTTLQLDAPREVSVDQRSTLPFAALYVRTLNEAAQLDAVRALLLVVVRHEDNALFVGPALRKDKRPAGGKATNPPKPGLKGSFYVADAASQLGIPWSRGTYTLRALIRERHSNPCQTQIGALSTDFRDDAVEAYVEARREEHDASPPQSVWPPLPVIRGAIGRVLDGGIDPFPNYRKREGSPELPEGAGIRFAVDRVAEPGEGRRCVLRGSFRLPATDLERVPFDPATGRPVEVGAPGATAVVKIHLVGTGTRVVGPMVLPLRVPSFDPLGPPGGFVTGFFNIDLFAVTGVQQSPGTYFFTVFSRDQSFGPVPLGIPPRVE
ncbi:MAG: hypothetical protein KUG77_07595 [Nannocystaceae bacterium]|nr:hypothetical protein [Nannocystaceae bacterium]